MRSVEAEGNSIDEAIEDALKQLATTRDRVEIEILSNAVRGLFGIGGRRARVRATLRAPIDHEGPMLEPSEGRTERLRSQPTLPASATDDRAVARARGVLEQIIKHLDLRAEISVRRSDGQYLFELSGDSSGVLIGRRGQMLDAIEYVLNRVASRDEAGAPRIVVDSQNYRVRRRKALEAMARRMATQAKKRRKPISLNPLSPRDRRIVHLVLQADSSLITRSSGKGYYRRLVIVPAGGGRLHRSNPDDE